MRLTDTSPVVPGREEQEQILGELLASSVFGRSEQLRQMLRYVVREEMEGRGEELSEYRIAVNALGRPAGFSPEVDSTVRTRMYELRRRLEEHYRTTPGGAWRIEVAKGSYRARFVAQRLESSVVVTAAAESTPAVVATAGRPGYWRGVATGGGVVLAVGVIVWLLVRLWPMEEGERAVRQVWGPLVEPQGTVSILLATAPQLWVREFGSEPIPAKDPPFALEVPEDPRFFEWYRRTTLRDPRRLMLHPNKNSPMGGEAEAAVTLAGFLGSRGMRMEMLLGDRPSSAIEIKERNAVILGRPEYCRAAAELQPTGGLAVRYLPERREYAVVSTDGKEAYYRQDSGRITYGLATVLTQRTDVGLRRKVLFAGVNSDGSDAAMDYLTSRLNLTELVKELVSKYGAVPESYQVVVKSRSSDNRTMFAERVAVRAITAP
jgi:hypothetical protein